MNKEDMLIEKNRLTKEEFLEKNKDLFEQYAIPIDENTKYVSGNLGNKDDIKS